MIIKYEETLVGCFDIYAYSAFIKSRTMDDCIPIIRGLFEKIARDAGSSDRNIRVKHWIFSDTIIVTPDLDRHILDHNSIDFFLLVCAGFMYRGIQSGLPLRGAIGGGYFYQDDEMLLSSALVDAYKFEKAQNWFGTVITPSAFVIIQKYVPEFGFNENPTNAYRFIKKGAIPWKEDKIKELSINKLEHFYYIVPPYIYTEWTTYLPQYLKEDSRGQKLIRNSYRIYSNEK